MTATLIQISELNLAINTQLATVCIVFISVTISMEVLFIEIYIKTFLNILFTKQFIALPGLMRCQQNL
ncbi:hypothetical protein CLV81_3708 [Flagellimonas meridianipacifica]|uniref:Uncharacterized protein n=1 Tax=Flagellimonas meridianipacifica TaxID=1080225 RepID=A0A2T0MCU5_9FLAO|nr:hypothetical protein CLV81_3708 [Allomuricauda pacifica]